MLTNFFKLYVSKRLTINKGGIDLNKEIEIFKNEELKLQVRTIQNDDGSISVNAEDTAIGFGWIREKSGKEYE